MLLHKNKKAFFDYEILREFTAGIVLSGGEVRSCREGQINLKGSYISIHNKQAVLKGATISQFKYDTARDYNPTRERSLLLCEKELNKIDQELHTTGLTLIPLALITQGRLIKLEIGIARGKKLYDKRESIKKRDLERRKIV